MTGTLIKPRRCRILLGMLLLPFALAQGAKASALSATLSTPKQGQTIEVTAQVDGDAPEPALIFNKRTYKMFPSGPSGKAAATGGAASGGAANGGAATGGEDSGIGNGAGNVYKTLLSIPANLDPGSYTLSAAGASLKLKVLDAKFPVQRLTLPKSKDNFKTSPGEEEAVDQAKKRLTSERMWGGAFARPSKGRVSAGFGLRRIVNGKLLKDYFHSGLDFAGGLGSPVTACAPGTIAIAKTGWRLHGNTVAIDHGQGVVSFYIHLQKVLVEEGQKVKKGETIGKIGQTGRANGPHLHFSIYVNETAANPWEWFKGVGVN